MKTIEEMRKMIEDKCSIKKFGDCVNCPLRNNDKSCYTFASDEEIIRNYNIMFSKEEKVLNIDKYRDEIIRLMQENNSNHLGAITTCCINHCGRCSITLGYSFKWLFEEYKELIKLSQFEYDLLRTNDQSHDRKISHYRTYKHMKEVGHYKGIKNWDMTIKEILDNCEVVENEEN